MSGVGGGSFPTTDMSKQIVDDSGPAFPSHDPDGVERVLLGPPKSVHARGITMRDYFAASALQGLLACKRAGEPKLWYADTDEPTHADPTDAQSFVIRQEQFAAAAYALADAMLAHRSKPIA